MSRDTWQMRRPATRIQKIRQKLTLPAASYECFEDKGGVRIQFSGGGPLAPIQTTPTAFEITSALTLECWIYPEAFSNVIILGISNQYELRTTSAGKLRLTLYKGGAQTVISATTIPSFQWVHVAATWDGVTAKLYINGVQDANTLSLTPSLATGAGTPYLFGNLNWTGVGSEARIWNKALTKDEMNFRRNRPISAAASGLDDNLVGYWKCNEGTGVNSITYNKITANALDFNVYSNNRLVSDEYPPLIYGASFIVAESTITLGRPVSLIFPKTAPTGFTGMLCVSYNNDGVDYRYKLWDMDGVDIAPAPETYRGQKLLSPFKLELWNIDGNKTLEVPSDLVLNISYCTNPITSQDTSQIAAATISMDTTLAEAFPLTFPLTFNSQQTY